MTWTELLRAEAEGAYQVAERLLDLSDDAMLGWKPPSGRNWMTQGQLLRHLADACGRQMRGFVMGDWGPPSPTSADAPLPPSEAMPSVSSVAEARRLLAEDREVTRQMLTSAGERRLDQEPTPAPWDPTCMSLGRRLLEVVRHLDTHKSQLFYYLKLQGQRVHTGHLWGL